MLFPDSDASVPLGWLITITHLDVLFIRQGSHNTDALNQVKLHTLVCVSYFLDVKECYLAIQYHNNNKSIKEKALQCWLLVVPYFSISSNIPNFLWWLRSQSFWLRHPLQRIRHLAPFYHTALVSFFYELFLSASQIGIWPTYRSLEKWSIRRCRPDLGLTLQ